MLLKCENGTYVDATTGNAFDIKNVADSEATAPNWNVRLSVPLANRGIPFILHSGYATKEDAQAALDELMLDHRLDAVTIQPPVAPEEEAPAETEEVK